MKPWRLDRMSARRHSTSSVFMKRPLQKHRSGRAGRAYGAPRVAIGTLEHFRGKWSPVQALIGPRACAKVRLGGIAMELIDRIKAILLTPRTEWPVIAQEKGETSALFIRYVAILALIPALARFIGTSLVGGYAPILSSLLGALVTYLSGFAVVYGLALIINALAPR